MCTQNIVPCAVTETLFCLLHFLSQEHFTLIFFLDKGFSYPEMVICFKIFVISKFPLLTDACTHPTSY